MIRICYLQAHSQKHVFHKREREKKIISQQTYNDTLSRLATQRSCIKPLIKKINNRIKSLKNGQQAASEWYANKMCGCKNVMLMNEIFVNDF